ncbi:flagellar assembly protein FliW [Bacillus sp. JCM 19041]|uniref:flagellar assembly protein FliW n=1 Tax=Bacillus sp. JCM 19041 TaxID=1460637 RepID=UPI0006D06765
MQVETSYLGTVNSTKDDILLFAGGLPGFLEEKEFVLLPFGQSHFFLLQSVQSKHLAFICADPFVLWDNYEVKLDDASLEQLAVQKQEDVAIFVILTIEQPFSATTANLRAPIIINSKNKRAKQVMLDDYKFSPKTALPKAESKERC